MRQVRIGLYQSEDGRRTIGFAKPNDGAFFTALVDSVSDINALHRLDLFSTKEGVTIALDAHGIWLTELERDTLWHHGSLDSVKWSTGICPWFPPK
jgi:hypothetical protein